MTAHTCAGGLNLRSGSQRHRHFVGFFNVPVQALTRGQPFYTVIPRNCPIQSPFTTRWGYGGHILVLNPPPRGPHVGVGGSNRTVDKIFCNVHLFRVLRSWTGSVQMKSSMTFIRGNRYIERERKSTM